MATDPKVHEKKNAEWIEYFKSLGKGTVQPGVQNQPKAPSSK